jgi:hypothetical protein
MPKEERRYLSLLQIMLPDRQDVPDQYEIDFFQDLAISLCDEDDTIVANVAAMDWILETHPEIVHHRDERLIRRCIRKIRGIFTCKTTAIGFVKMLLDRYPIDITARDFESLMFVSALINPALGDYIRYHDVIYQGSRVHCYRKEYTLVVGCDQELPIEGWYAIATDDYYLYSNCLCLDVEGHQFLELDIFKLGPAQPLSPVEDSEAIEFRTGPSYQDRCTIKLCGILNDYVQMLRRSTRQKSARK